MYNLTCDQAEFCLTFYIFNTLQQIELDRNEIVSTCIDHLGHTRTSMTLTCLLRHDTAIITSL